MAEEKKVNEASSMILFDSNEQLEKILKSLEMRVKDSKVYGTDGELAKCDCCDEPITITNLGTLMPGSEYFYCDNPACMMKYYVRTL